MTLVNQLRRHRRRRRRHRRPCRFGPRFRRCKLSKSFSSRLLPKGFPSPQFKPSLHFPTPSPRSASTDQASLKCASGEDVAHDQQISEYNEVNHIQWIFAQRDITGPTKSLTLTSKANDTREVEQLNFLKRSSEKSG